MTITQEEIYSYGYDNGSSIANNVYVENDISIGDTIEDTEWCGEDTVTGNNWRDYLLYLTMETEANHFRQFSPFEIFAKQLNDLDRGGNEGAIDTYEAWELYEKGVYDGAIALLSSLPDLSD